MLNKLFVLLSLVASVAVAVPAGAMPAQVLLIRHGEKPDSGSDLNDQGWARARALPNLFTRPEFSQFGKPAALYAMGPKEKDSAENTSRRAVETLKYLSESMGLPIRSEFTKHKDAEMVQQILADRSLDGKLVVICWEHKVLTDIAQDFGLDPAPDYPEDKFDRAWLLTLAADGGAPEFRDLPEQLLPGDDAK